MPPVQLHPPTYWLKAIASGLLVGVPLLTTPVKASNPLWNPCLEAYYEDLASNAPSPQNCPPTAESGAIEFRNREPELSTRPPILLIPSSTESLDGRWEDVGVRLRNNTNMAVTYQVISPDGYSNPSRLLAQQELTLSDLPAPFTIQITYSDGQIAGFTPVLENEDGQSVVILEALDVNAPLSVTVQDAGVITWD